nr:MAG TPA: hypothetical protein [Bacteriophage sp.]
MYWKWDLNPHEDYSSTEFKSVLATKLQHSSKYYSLIRGIGSISFISQ